MNFLDKVIKIIKSIKLIQIKNEIKNPSISPVVNYKSPSVTNINFSRVEINKKQLNRIAEETSEKTIKKIKDQFIVTLTRDKTLQGRLSRIPSEKLPMYITNTVSGTATVASFQTDFLESGGILFLSHGEMFKKGYEVGAKGGGKIKNVKIYKTGKDGLTIQYDEE